MKFNELAKTIVENITPTIVASEELEGKRGRAANPEIEKLVAQGLPYWKARALVKKGLSGAAPVTGEPVPSAPSGMAVLGGNNVSNQKTQAAVDDFVAGNPQASVEDVIAHLKDLNNGPLAVKFPYITNPKDVAKMVAVATGTEPEEEPTFDPEAEKKAKMAKLRAFLMMPKAKRDQYLARTAKASKATSRVRDDDEEEDEEEVSGKIDMRDDPVDPTEL